MARKIYTQEQLEQRVRDALEKEYQRRYEEERIEIIYRRMRELEERLWNLEHPNETRNECCECVSKY